MKEPKPMSNDTKLPASIVSLALRQTSAINSSQNPRTHNLLAQDTPGGSQSRMYVSEPRPQGAVRALSHRVQKTDYLPALLLRQVRKGRHPVPDRAVSQHPKQCPWRRLINLGAIERRCFASALPVSPVTCSALSRIQLRAGPLRPSIRVERIAHVCGSDWRLPNRASSPTQRHRKKHADVCLRHRLHRAPSRL